MSEQPVEEPVVDPEPEVVVEPDPVPLTKPPSACSTCG